MHGTPGRPANPKTTEARRPREETAAQREAAAGLRLKVARRLEAFGFPTKAHVHYREIVNQYPDTQAAKEAARPLERMKP